MKRLGWRACNGRQCMYFQLSHVLDPLKPSLQIFKVGIMRIVRSIAELDEMIALCHEANLRSDDDMRKNFFHFLHDATYRIAVGSLL